MKLYSLRSLLLVGLVASRFGTASAEAGYCQAGEDGTKCGNIVEVFGCCGIGTIEDCYALALANCDLAGGYTNFQYSPNEGGKCYCEYDQVLTDGTCDNPTGWTGSSGGEYTTYAMYDDTTNNVPPKADTVCGAPPPPPTCVEDSGIEFALYETEAECQQAATDLGLEWGSSSDSYPTKGCYFYWEGTLANSGSGLDSWSRKAYFGTNTDGSTTGYNVATTDDSGALRFPCPCVTDWCLEFHSFTAALDGVDTTDDMTLIYPASEPTATATPDNADQDKYYKVTLMDVATCQTPLVYADVGLTPSTPTYATGYLKVGVAIDTTKIETGGLETNVVATAGTFDVTFCAKVDLYNKVEGTSYKVETSETDLTLSFDKTKNFEFTITAAKEARGSRATDVVVQHDLTSCVCAIGDEAAGACKADADYSLNPGDKFKFCVKDTSSSLEMTLAELKDVAFKNDQDTDLDIPILNSVGGAVGPVTDLGCTLDTGVTTCVIEARTYAQMYESVDGTTNVITNIASGSKITGTAVLAFKTRRRLGGSLVEEKNLVEVNFGGSRALQQDGTTPVNDFDTPVNLATPPDRSTAAGSSSAFAFVSLMVGGFVGMMI